jgi:hypothetical protein
MTPPLGGVICFCLTSLFAGSVPGAFQQRPRPWSGENAPVQGRCTTRPLAGKHWLTRPSAPGGTCHHRCRTLANRRRAKGHVYGDGVVNPL